MVEKTVVKVAKPLVEKAPAKVTNPMIEKSVVNVAKPLVEKAPAKVINPLAEKVTAKVTKPLFNEKINSTDKNDSATRYYKYPIPPRLSQ